MTELNRLYKQLWRDTHTDGKLRHGNMRGTVLPIVSIVGGPKPYLWIGNNAPGNMECFGTITLPRLVQLLERARVKNQRHMAKGN